MFIVSHGLIAGYSVKHKGAPWMWYAALGSMMPDVSESIERVPHGVYVFLKLMLSGASAHTAVMGGVSAGYDRNAQFLFSGASHYSHSLIILLGAYVLWQLFSRGRAYGYFLWGWFLHIVTDVFSHYAPHEYFAPTSWALSFPSIWSHNKFWAATSLGTLGGSLCIEVPIVFALCWCISRFVSVRLRAG